MSNNKEVKLKPLKGCIVRDPVTLAHLSEKGEMKSLSGRNGGYWKRRLKEGSVEIVPASRRNSDK